MKQDSSDLYDFNTKCSLCDCIEGTHLQFHQCPILESQPICKTDCCLIGCLKNDIAERFSKTIGKEMTLEQVNSICRSCGNNYGTQNEELARKLENDL